MGVLAGLVLAAGGCRQLNESHCGNQLGNATCEQRDMTTPFCDRCEPANDGCVAAQPVCGEASSGPEATASVTVGESSTDAVSTTAVSTAATEAVDSSSGEPPNLCGNGMIDESEACDGDVLPAGANCMDEGFGDATPGCVEDCTAIDYTNCPEYMQCGNGEVAFGEECDGMNLNGGTCGDFPNLTGAGLACNECMYDTSACLPCVENGEDCTAGQSVCCDKGNICAGLADTQCCIEGTGTCLL